MGLPVFDLDFKTLFDDLLFLVVGFLWLSSFSLNSWVPLFFFWTQNFLVRIEQARLLILSSCIHKFRRQQHRARTLGLDHLLQICWGFPGAYGGCLGIWCETVLSQRTWKTMTVGTRERTLRVPNPWALTSLTHMSARLGGGQGRESSPPNFRASSTSWHWLARHIWDPGMKTIHGTQFALFHVAFF